MRLVKLHGRGSWALIEKEGAEMFRGRRKQVGRSLPRGKIDASRAASPPPPPAWCLAPQTCAQTESRAPAPRLNTCGFSSPRVACPLCRST